MTKRSSPDVPFFLLGGYNILGTLTQIEDSMEAILERSDVLGDSWEAQMFVGVRKGEITQEGFYDDAANSVHEALSTGPAGNSRVLCYGLAGTATGAEFLGWEGAMQVNYERIVSRGALTKARARYMNDGTIEKGKMLRSLAAASVTGASTGTPIDNGVSSTGGAGYLQYTSGGEAQVSIVHSSDNITYAAIITFASSTGARDGVRTVTTAVIERYTAVDYTTGGVTGTASFNFMVGLYRGPLSS